MKAIMTGVALAALIAGAPALAAGERQQVAQAEPQTEQMQEEMQAAPTTCAEGETTTAEGEPCPPDSAAAPADEESDAAATAPDEESGESDAAATSEPLPAESDETEAVQAEEPQDEATEIVAAEGGKFIEEQSEDAVLASELIGLTVYNPADEALGDVNDIVWTADGGIEGVIVGVGGFLGIGEKSVAVAYSAVNISTDENGNKKLVLDATLDELTAAPEFLTTAEKLAMIRAEQQQALPPASGGGMNPAPLPEPVPAQ